MFSILNKSFIVGRSMLSDKGSKFSNFGILRLITAFVKKSLSFIATVSSFVISVSY